MTIKLPEPRSIRLANNKATIFTLGFPSSGSSSRMDVQAQKDLYGQVSTSFEVSHANP